MKLLIKQSDNDGRLGLIPGFLQTDWNIEVADFEDANALRNGLAGADAAISMNWRKGMPPAPKLKLLHLPGAGTDDIAFDAVPAQASVCNVFEHEVGIAEYVLGAMLQWVIGIPRMDAGLRHGEWRGSHLYGPRHGELYGQTLGIVGYGRIGRGVAARARAFGLNIVACSRTPGPADGLVDQVDPMSALHSLLARSDFILLALPLDASTSGLVGRAEFDRMKPSAVIINIARGALIDERALFEACRDRRIGGAIIDTWYRYPAAGATQAAPSSLPFHELENIIMTPHGSGWTEGLLPRRCRFIAQNLDRVARGESLLNVVRRPTIAALPQRTRDTNMEHAATEKAAQTLWTTWLAGGRIDALPADCRPATRMEGYAIQSQIARLSGQKVFGWKIAATSKAGQKHIGVDGPLAGRLLEKRVVQSGGAFSLANNMMNVAEAEFAFRMARDLPPRKAPYSIDEVLDAVASMHPAIEIPDSRYVNFVSVGAAQLIADNACACFFVLGPAVVADWRRHDLPHHPVTAHINGKFACSGIGENVLGDPRIALAWIANELSLEGDMLRAGETVTTGTCIVPAAIKSGDHVIADFGVFGRVEVHLTA